MRLDGEWFFKVDSLERGMEERWFVERADRSDWSEVVVPEHWDRYDLEEYDGVGWFATTFEIEDLSKPLALFFGGVDDDAEVWVNGKSIGTHIGYSEPFFLELSDAVRPGENELVVRVNDYSGPGGIYKPISILPVAEVESLLRSKFSDEPARESADWVKDAVIYEVYLRSFSKEGTFKALERRLHEIKDLGVTVIWLMPIHPVGELNRKGNLGSPYSIQNYYATNPEFGTIEDFKSLVKATHAHGMKIILDLVVNHTSWDTEIILDHPEWYTTNRNGEIVAPNADWRDVADFNYDRHELRKYIMEMMEYWVRDVGVDGFRCDVAEMVPTDFWERARKELDQIKQVMLLSEGTLPEHHLSAFDLTYSWNVYDVLGKVIHGTTPVKVFDEILRNESLQYPRGSLRMRFNTNHDKNAWDEPAVKKFSPQGAKATALLTFTFPGVPLIYNGEEVGNEKALSLFEKTEIDWQQNPTVRQFFKQLGTLRSSQVSLRRGDYTPLPNSDNQKVFSFLRRSGDDPVIVVINFSRQPKEVSVSIPESVPNRLKEYFTGSNAETAGRKLTLHLEGLDYKVFLKN